MMSWIILPNEGPLLCFFLFSLESGIVELYRAVICVSVCVCVRACVCVVMVFFSDYLDVPHSSEDGHVSLTEIFKNLFLLVEYWHLHIYTHNTLLLIETHVPIST